MDKIYVPDNIPLSYNIVVFKDNGNIELYERMSYTTPGIYKYYILLNNSQNKVIVEQEGFYVQEGQTKEINYAHNVELSHNWYDRPDMLNILCLFCCVAVLTLWLTNLFTSIFKKGGLLGGLF